MSLGLLIASTSCNDEDITIKIVDLPDAIPYNEIGSGKILFNRYHKTYLIDIDDQSVSELIIDPVGGAVISPDGERIAMSPGHINVMCFDG